MHDSFTQSGTTGPRCSFCGRSEEQLKGGFVNGSGASICRYCLGQVVRKFGARLERVDEEVEVESRDDDGLLPVDFGTAYLAIEDARPPIRDLVRRAFGPEAVGFVAEGVAWHRRNLGLGLQEYGVLRQAAGDMIEEAVSYALEDLHHDQ